MKSFYKIVFFLIIIPFYQCNQEKNKKEKTLEVKQIKDLKKKQENIITKPWDSLNRFNTEAFLLEYGKQNPETKVIHPRKGHIGRTDLQRNHPVGKADEGRHDRAEDHDQPVHRGQLVEQLRVDELQPRLEQLGADAQREHAADHEHGEREQQVHRADVLVVRGEHPAPPALQGAVVVIVGVIVTRKILVITTLIISITLIITIIG